MATFKFKGLEEYERMLSKLQEFETVQAVCGATIYSGAEVMADAIKGSIEAIPVVDHRTRGSESAKLKGVTSEQKKGLIEGFGISPMQHTDGFYNVKLGFDGYNSVKTAKYPNGQPNSMIARSVNNGASFREKTQFIDKAVSKAKKKTEQAMVETMDKELEKVTKGR